MDLRSHFGAMWRRKWLIGAIAVLAFLVVFVLTSLQSKVYQADAEISVTPAFSADTGQSASQDAATYLASLYAALGTTRPVLSEAATASHLGISEVTVQSRISVVASQTVGFITITADGASASAAQALDQALVSSLLKTVAAQQAASLASELAPVKSQIQSVSAQLAASGLSAASQSSLTAQLGALQTAETNAELAPVNQLTVVSPARANTAPVRPTPKRTAALAFVVALVLAAEGAAAAELIGDRFNAEQIEEDVSRLTGIPVLAHVPTGDNEDTVEALRTLRTNLLFMNEAEDVRTVAVVSPDAAAGKSFVAVRLATSMAELGVPAAIIDGDMRRPVIHERMDIPRQPGLSDLLGGSALADCGRIDPDHENLLIVPAGSPIEDPAGALSRHLRRRVLERLDQARLIVLDTPAESVFPDAATIAASADATIVVIDAGGTSRRSVRTMLNRLRQVRARPIGVVVNHSSVAARSTTYYSRRPGQDDR